MLNKRLQILIDEERYRDLVARAKEENISVGSLVRRAIDSIVPPGASRKARAGRRILAAPPMEVPEDPADLKAEIRRARSRGL